MGSVSCWDPRSEDTANRRGERGSKHAAIRSSVAEKPPDMTNRVIAFVCLLGVSGALGQAQDFAQQTSDYYRDIQQGLEFIQSRSGQAQPSYAPYQDATSLLPGVFPSVFLGGLGLLGAAYLSARLDSLYNNPPYDICSDGFDAGEIVGPSGYSRDGQ